MRASQFATLLRDDVIKLNREGEKTISAKSLTRFLDEKIPLLEEAEKKDQVIAVDFRIEHYKAQIASNNQMFASVLDYGKHALNAAMIVNAGASVALLTLIGNLAGSPAYAHFAPRFASPVLLFVLGVLAAAMATGGAYCTQYFYTQTPDRPTGKRFHRATGFLSLASYAMFLAGAWRSYQVLELIGH